MIGILLLQKAVLFWIQRSHSNIHAYLQKRHVATGMSYFQFTENQLRTLSLLSLRDESELGEVGDCGTPSTKESCSALMQTHQTVHSAASYKLRDFKQRLMRSITWRPEASSSSSSSSCQIHVTKTCNINHSKQTFKGADQQVNLQKKTNLCKEIVASNAVKPSSK